MPNQTRPDLYLDTLRNLAFGQTAEDASKALAKCVQRSIDTGKNSTITTKLRCAGYTRTTNAITLMRHRAGFDRADYANRDTADIADLFGVHKGTVQRWVSTGALKARTGQHGKFLSSAKQLKAFALNHPNRYRLSH